MGTQYTVRAVPDAIDHALRQRAKREAKSLDAVVVEALARGLELDAKSTPYADLDQLIGTLLLGQVIDGASGEGDLNGHQGIVSLVGHGLEVA